MSEGAKLPVHGFVLAGGQSSRMGRDKALLEFRGRPMAEIAVTKLREFCAKVSIAGNREDLRGFAPVVSEGRTGIGPVAGVEAGLQACTEAWAMFMPVDVPMIPAELLRGWAEAVLERAEASCGASFLLVENNPQPAFCMIRRECSATVSAAVEKGERRIRGLLAAIDDTDTGNRLWPVNLWPVNAERFAPPGKAPTMALWFSNLNTPDEALEAELLANHYPEDL